MDAKTQRDFDNIGARITVEYHKKEARNHPMYAARVVAKGWGHGGYSWFAVTDDGALLCASCVKSEWRQIVYAAQYNLRDGWRVVGYTNSGEMETSDTCAHCGATLGGQD